MLTIVKNVVAIALLLALMFVRDVGIQHIVLEGDIIQLCIKISHASQV